MTIPEPFMDHVVFQLETKPSSPGSSNRDESWFSGVMNELFMNSFHSRQIPVTWWKYRDICKWCFLSCSFSFFFSFVCGLSCCSSIVKSICEIGSTGTFSPINAGRVKQVWYRPSNGFSVARLVTWWGRPSSRHPPHGLRDCFSWQGGSCDLHGPKAATGFRPDADKLTYEAFFNMSKLPAWIGERFTILAVTLVNGYHPLFYIRKQWCGTDTYTPTFISFGVLGYRVVY